MTVTDQLASMIRFAQAQIGQPYVWAGDGGPDGGFDCSGLTKAAYAAAGVALPRTARTQYAATQRVSVPQPGDLVFFGGSDATIHHVGIYVGSGMMIDAPTFGHPVGVHKISGYGDLYGYTRPLAGADSQGLRIPIPIPGVPDVNVPIGPDVDQLVNSIVGTLTKPLLRLTVTGLAVTTGAALVVVGAYRAVTR